MSIFSTENQIKEIIKILSRYTRLPFSVDTIPGAIMEGVLAYVRDAEVLNTYDFVDVIDESTNLGWQVKSTKSNTPVTWKRAKIANSPKLIQESHKSEEGLQKLGDEIIKFCNNHALESLEKYDLQEIGYARLIVYPKGKVKYFERKLCDRVNPIVFNPNEFVWSWSKQKKTSKKEQLSALHGVHKPTNKKWWAWHGLGENQLHFSGEGAWWPPDDQAATFSLPSAEDRLSLKEFMGLLEEVRVSDFDET